VKVDLGEGFAAPMALIENEGLVHPATADTGNIAPSFPVEASRKHQYGIVIMDIDIAVDGHVTNVRVTRSSGFPLLDNAARTRLLTWHFHPATKDGIPTANTIPFEIHFDP
jgi:protein TonB